MHYGRPCSDGRAPRPGPRSDVGALSHKGSGPGLALRGWTNGRNMHQGIRDLHSHKERQQDLINELFFTYRQLQRMLPKIIKRAKGADVGALLTEQVQLERTIVQRLWTMALAHGLKPKPCICKEPSRLLEELQAVGHALYCDRARPNALIPPLKGVRTFLLASWNDLQATLGSASDPTARKLREETAALRSAEETLQRKLIAFHEHLAGAA